MSKQVVIVAPHCDDELIGCYSVLKTNDYCNIVYTTNMRNSRREEATKLRDHFNVRQFFVNYDIPPILIEKENTFYFPDHINENHPDHRKAGMIGEKLLRDGYDVIFYTIQKNTPYIFELNEIAIKQKENILNDIYSSQKSLWEYEKKYIFFEGYMKWLIS